MKKYLGLISTTLLVAATGTAFGQLPGIIWRGTGSLNDARFVHTATLLQNGMVLVAGGEDNNGISDSAELTTRRAASGL